MPCALCISFFVDIFRRLHGRFLSIEGLRSSRLGRHLSQPPPASVPILISYPYGSNRTTSEPRVFEAGLPHQGQEAPSRQGREGQEEGWGRQQQAQEEQEGSAAEGGGGFGLRTQRMAERMLAQIGAHGACRASIPRRAVDVSGCRNLLHSHVIGFLFSGGGPERARPLCTPLLLLLLPSFPPSVSPPFAPPA